MQKLKLDPSDSEYRKVSLFSRILSSQLNQKNAVLERGHEQIVLHLLNTEMNTTSAVNCRSGLDRTGFYTE